MGKVFDIDIQKYNTGLTLDVGCGSNPKGRVNLDLYYKRTPHLVRDVEIDIKINFVRGDIHSLPFKDNSFELVNASQVLEHALHPTLAVREMKRVSSKYVTIDVPNLKKISTEENPTHIFSWSEYTFYNFLSQFFSEVYIAKIKLAVPNSLLGNLRYGERSGTFIRFIEGLINRLVQPPSLRAICKVQTHPPNCKVWNELIVFYFAQSLENLLQVTFFSD